MESAYNREDDAPTRHIIPPNKSSSDRNGLYLVESLAKGVPWNSPYIAGHG